ncbi:MFS general substrate transporter [Rhizopogon vinicolor AM-OR11-026]|uniref:MFS general substrate transporter n=1 Tax=Rhizopogon vinicolor AM-OR11-026 TaxID=1314800 RepID=A0A1B7MKQ7_9AGAM|nr:MFS general substrate transporter [Rhizopogon vinicolor AM-OR11-026]
MADLNTPASCFGSRSLTVTGITDDPHAGRRLFCLSIWHLYIDPAIDLYEGGYNDPVYEAKALILNRAIQGIGMGRYQWYLYFVAGFGWFALCQSDVTWTLMNGLIIAPVINEFRFNGAFLSLASNIGLFAGALFWGLGCDIWGRRWPFHITLFITGMFGLAVGGAPSFVALASLFAVVTSGVAGNMPVDNALFLDCTRANNMGWRYLSFALGGITLVLGAIRLFSFTLLESPRFLSGADRDADAVEIIHKLAKFNGKTSTLTVEDLDRVMPGGSSSSRQKHRILNKSSKYDSRHIRALFCTPKMAWSTSLLIAIWAILGLSLTLYNNFLPYLLFSRGLTGAFLFATTTARTSNQLLGWNCGYLFCNNITFGVMTAMSVEVFPAKDRGTGADLMGMTTRLFGILGPIIALYANLATAVPIYIAGALIIFAGGLVLLLPYEPRGKASI